MNDLRLFFALPISPRVIEIITHHINQFRASGADVKWVAPENLHVTLKFLGTTSERRLETVIKAGTRAHAGIGPFETCWDGFGAFPTLKNARVIWAGLSKGGELVKKLALTLETELLTEGFPSESREFKPHLTIGRMRSTAGLEKLAKLIDSSKNCRIGTMKVASFSLVKSTLTPGGPRYEELTKFSLGEMNNGQA